MADSAASDPQFDAPAELSRRFVRRRRRIPLSRLVRWGVFTLALAFVAGLLLDAAGWRWWKWPTRRAPAPPRVVYLPSGRPVEPAESSDKPAPLSNAPPTVAPPAAATPAVVEPYSGEPSRDEPADDTPRSAAALERLLERSLVLIEGGGSGRSATLGAGFIVERGDLVATSLHVISSATRAEVRRFDGSRYAIAGYVAIAPEHDLAVLQLAGAPVDAEPLALRVEPPAVGEPVSAVGHPAGLRFSLYDGQISQLATTSGLPASSRRSLAEQLPGIGNVAWVQHTARLSPGNSGGPLLDAHGRVLGVNAWFNFETNFGYAVAAHHLAGLLARTSDEVAPLERYARADRQAAARLERLSAARLNELLLEAEGFGWLPDTEPEYAVLQEVAWLVTYANLPAQARGPDALDADQWEALVAAADEALARLGRRRWDAVGQATLVNEMAAEQVARPHAGVFCFATLERIVAADDGRRAALVRLAGVDQRLLLPLEGQLFEAEPDEPLLVLGVNYEGRVVRYGENPLQLIAAPVIVTAPGTILTLRAPPSDGP